MHHLDPPFVSSDEHIRGRVVTISSCRTVKGASRAQVDQIGRQVSEYERQDGNDFKAHVIHGLLDTEGDLCGFVKRYRSSILVFASGDKAALEKSRAFDDVYDRFCADFGLSYTIHVVVVPSED
jgi:hypothetical protein